MFGLRYIKFQPTDYVLQYHTGQLVREGAGLAFFYFSPVTSLVSVPIGSVDVPFIFEEVTADFQDITVQGQITYRIADPKQVSKLLNYTLAPHGRGYGSDDPIKLPQRLVNYTQVLTRAALKAMPLRDILGASEGLVGSLLQGLRETEAVLALGVEVLGLSILAVKPKPETARALEAEAREEILRKADEAIYARRNAAVEQERAIKENELNTEIAVENKKRQIRETQMDAELAVQRKHHELQEAGMAAKIQLEQRNRDLVALVAENAKQEADAKAYGIAQVLQALGNSDTKLLQALATVGMAPGQLLALAFKELAESTDKIGQLNISPDLLRELLGNDRAD